MRPSVFQARKVGRCARQSTRLWICIRSRRSVFNSAIDFFIWAMPLSQPEVQTLVAMKALSRVPAAASRSPTTPSAAPYIGERRAVGRLAGDIEGPPSAAAEDGIHLAGGGNLALVHAVPRGWLGPRRLAEQDGAGKTQESRAFQGHSHGMKPFLVLAVVHRWAVLVRRRAGGEW